MDPMSFAKMSVTSHQLERSDRLLFTPPALPYRADVPKAPFLSHKKFGHLKIFLLA